MGKTTTTTGWYSPYGANDQTLTSGIGWSSVSSAAYAPDGTYASFRGSGSTRILRLRQFPLPASAVPLDATNISVEIEITRYAGSAGVRDNTIRLSLYSGGGGGSASEQFGLNKADLVTDWPTTATAKSYTFSGLERWQLYLPDSFGSSTTRLGIDIVADTTGANGYVDGVRMRVTYDVIDRLTAFKAFLLNSNMGPTFTMPSWWNGQGKVRGVAGSAAGSYYGSGAGGAGYFERNLGNQTAIVVGTAVSFTAGGAGDSYYYSDTKLNPGSATWGSGPALVAGAAQSVTRYASTGTSGGVATRNDTAVTGDILSSGGAGGSYSGGGGGAGGPNGAGGNGAGQQNSSGSGNFGGGGGGGADGGGNAPNTATGGVGGAGGTSHGTAGGAGGISGSALGKAGANGSGGGGFYNDGSSGNAGGRGGRYLLFTSIDEVRVCLGGGAGASSLNGGVPINYFQSNYEMAFGGGGGAWGQSYSSGGHAPAAVMLELGFVVTTHIRAAETETTEVYDTAGTYSYTVPAGVTSLIVDGLGHRYSRAGAAFGRKTVTVTPGETLTVVIPAIDPSSNLAAGAALLQVKRGSTVLFTVDSASGYTGEEFLAATGGQASNCTADVAFSGGNRPALSSDGNTAYAGSGGDAGPNGAGESGSPAVYADSDPETGAVYYSNGYGGRGDNLNVTFWDRLNAAETATSSTNYYAVGRRSWYWQRTSDGAWFGPKSGHGGVALNIKSTSDPDGYGGGFIALRYVVSTVDATCKLNILE